MKFCANYKPGAKRPERAPVAVPAGLLTMGLLVMTLLGAWGATALFLRGTELACCIKCRKEKLARGEEAPSCLPV